jgi:hypothetical protein
MRIQRRRVLLGTLSEEGSDDGLGQREFLIKLWGVVWPLITPT